MANKNTLFESMPVGKALASMAIPAIISQLITTFYNMADTFFIGMSNDPYKVAAASITGVLFFVMNSLANLFGVGGGSLISRLMGHKNIKEARHVCSFSIYGSLFISFIYSLVCFIFSEPLSILLGASSNTLAYAQSYLLWVVVIGGIPATVGVTLSHIIRSLGYSKESSNGLALGGILNVLLDPLFMFVILPKGNEVTGAAIATMISNIITLLYYLYIMLKHKDNDILTLSIKDCKVTRESFFSVFKVGLPSAISSLLASTSAIIRNNLTASYGDIEMAAYGIVTKIDQLPLNIGMGLCQGMMPLVAYNYAAKNYPRMKQFTKAAQTSGMICAVIFIVICELFAPHIISLFIEDELTTNYGAFFLRIACLATPFMISNFQKIYCLQSMGKGGASLLLSVCRQGVIAIPMLFILNAYFQVIGVISAQFISDLITFVVASIIYKKIYNELMKESETYA